MNGQNLEHFLTDFRNYIDKKTAQRTVPTHKLVGLVMRKPFTALDIDKLNALLDKAACEELALSVHETESIVSIIAYNPVRRSLRQVS